MRAALARSRGVYSRTLRFCSSVRSVIDSFSIFSALSALRGVALRLGEQDERALTARGLDLGETDVLGRMGR